jgi:hypothetical protein
VHACTKTKSLVALAQNVDRGAPVRASTARTRSEPGADSESSTTVSRSAMTVTGSAVAGDASPNAHCAWVAVSNLTWYGPGRTVANQPPASSVVAWNRRPRDASATTTAAKATG